MVQLGFYFDQSRCTGCYACGIACRDWHDIQDTGVQWRRITSCESGTFPEVRLSYLSLSCNHCARPACVEACPVGAITKGKDDGVVAVDRARCLGRDNCGMFCREACPYDVPQFARGEDAKMQMCTLCADRRAEGKNPACVDACPLRALDWGPLDELEKNTA